MDYNATFAISASGMAAARTRLDVAAANIANMNTAGTPGGRLYQPMKVLTLPVAAPRAGGPAPYGGVRVADVVPVAAAPRLAREPGHPAADANGMVAYPAVDHLGEMTTVMTSLRAYEANLAALNAAKTMAARALDIGGQ